ncbi:hypothetical protein CRG98_005144 [Punica granatum]|uniref:Integrase zinc-binding domain-containing protein n=1 Tax=Punica granatum TaxID=22663 RepID=A0A2I0L171_PUNGR|nr:hypothetical protein CRG98_005144 [Punica granatum]
MDLRKVQAIRDWAVPKDVGELRSFLGLTNYYQKFIKGYSKKMHDETVRRYWIEDGLLYAKRGGLYVSSGEGLRLKLKRECHDSRWVGHPEKARMMALLSHSYVWPKMEDDYSCMFEFVLSANKTRWRGVPRRAFSRPLLYRRSRGNPRPWTSFQDSQKLKNCPAETTAETFYRNVVKLFGLPTEIVRDLVILKLQSQIWKKINNKRWHKAYFRVLYKYINQISVESRLAKYSHAHREFGRLKLKLMRNGLKRELRVESDRTGGSEEDRMVIEMTTGSVELLGDCLAPFHAPQSNTTRIKAMTQGEIPCYA